MTTINLQRHQIIQKAVSQRPDAITDSSIQLWERLAVELISIIGEGGFQSLYSRSMHLASATFPWLLLKHPLQQGDGRFAGLKMSLDGQSAAVASEASITLLVTFVDILALLIGEFLTTSILRSAWDDGGVDTDVKELQ